MKESQDKVLLDHLKRHGKITSMEAFELYGITRLSARIYELKRDGNVITSNQKTTKNRYGNSVTYSEYELQGTDR